MSSVAEAEKKNDLSGIGFDPTDKELEIFHKEKMDMYKGTFIVCLVYAISAMILLAVIFWTDWGREYIYKKMLPASVTFIIGALFIIIFLVITIYNLKPRRVRNNIEKDEEIVCPDFWVLKKVEDDVKKDIVNNNTKSGNDKLIEDIKSKNDDALKYKCELDPSVYGDLKTYAEMKNGLYNGKSTLYNTGRKYKNRDDTTKQDYLYIHKKSSSLPSTEIPYTDETLSKYAQFSGMYQSGGKDITKASKHNDDKMKDNSIILSVKEDSTQANYNSKVPLICNVVYPQVLAKWDKDTPEQNKYRCEYAKACDIAWSDIGCEYKPPV